jgi:integrase
MENASMTKEPTVNRYRIFKRNSGIYFLEDNKTGKQESLRTLDKSHAQRVAFARNESERIPAGHRQIGIGYLQAGDPKIRIRKWTDVADAFCAQPVKESTKRRKLNAMKDPALRPLMSMILIETLPEHLLDVLAKGTVSTNCFLRKLHNLAKKLKWLPEEILTRGTWPVIRHKQNRAITREEHERILTVTPTEERRQYYRVLWETGASQSDIAQLTGDRVNLEEGTMTFHRVKMDGRKAGSVYLTMGPTLEEIITDLLMPGLLFPTLSQVGENDRSTAFAKQCIKAGVEGVTLHSYRYALIQRAKACGFNKRHAMAMVGQSREKTHDLYADGGAMTVPSLEEWELIYLEARNQRLEKRKQDQTKIIELRNRIAA